MMVLPANYYGVNGYPPVISLMMVVGTTAGASGATSQEWSSIIIHSYTPVFYCVAGLSVLAAIVLLLYETGAEAAERPRRQPHAEHACIADAAELPPVVFIPRGEAANKMARDARRTSRDRDRRGPGIGKAIARELRR